MLRNKNSLMQVTFVTAQGYKLRFRFANVGPSHAQPVCNFWNQRAWKGTQALFRDNLIERDFGKK